jgi:hypothetical protein
MSVISINLRTLSTAKDSWLLARDAV